MPELDLKSIRHLSRAISIVENQAAGYREVLSAAYRAQPSARVVGVTGPPGAGKSTLVDALTAHWAKDGERVAIIAVDPSSPFSGGAVLGDRVRMDRSGGLSDVYFRSLSARGQGGGLSAAVCDILAVLNGAGFGRVMVETVGAGQSDTAIAEAVDCTLVVGVPGLGDHVQASKAGVMEVGDVYVINKADLPGARTTAAQIDAALAVAYSGEPGINTVSADMVVSPLALASPGRQALMARHGDPAREATIWRPPVHLVSAVKADGLAELAASIDAFLSWCEESERLALRRCARIRSQILRALSGALMAPYLDGSAAAASVLADWVARVTRGEASPPEAVADLVRQRP